MANYEPAQNNGSQEMRDGWITPSVGTIRAFREAQDEGIVSTNHPALHQLADEIPAATIEGATTRRLISKLRSAAVQEIERGRNLVGLSAPQIGISRRAILANLNVMMNAPLDLSSLTVMINPFVVPIPYSETIKLAEGCFSCGPVNGVVERPLETFVSWLDENGDPQQAHFDGPSSVIVSHEVDHVNGLLVPDRAMRQHIGQGSPVDWVHAEEVAEREYGGQQHADLSWKRKCPPSQWRALKLGTFSLTNFDID